jgi:hypothetical protein
MSALGPANPAAAAAVSAAQYAAVAGAQPGVTKPSPKPIGPKRDKDELILAAQQLEGPEAVRELADNSQEQAREDHQEHDPSNGKPKGSPAKSLDLEA